MTAVLAVNLLGQMLMPLIIFPGNKIITTETLVEDYPWVLTTATDSGYIDRKTLLHYAELLRSQLGHQDSILLLADGHKT
jgi:hypothetical protein